MTTQNQPQAPTQSRWVFDPNHTQVEFSARHLGMMTVRGNFLDVTANGYIPSPEDGTSTVHNGDLVVRHADGRLSDGREPLNVEALLHELRPDDRLDEPVSEEVKMGHIHLYVANLQDSLHFYRDVLGFQELNLVPRLRFGEVTLHGYLPHIIAFNTWQGEGAPPPPENSLGMRYFEVVLPDQAELSRVIERVKQAGGATEATSGGMLVRDPSQIGVVLTARSNEQEG